MRESSSARFALRWRELSRRGLVVIVLALGGLGCGDNDALPRSPCGADAASYGCLQEVARGPIADTIAVNTHFSTNVDRVALAKLRAAGVHTLRNDLTWQDIEREKGIYDFTATGYDALVAAAEAEGIRMLLILDYGNRLYGATKAVVSDEGRAAFAAYAEAAARRYGGHGHIWEVWNEPNSPSFWIGSHIRPDPAQYALLVQAAAGSVRRADPGGKLLAGAVFYGDLSAAEIFGAIPGKAFLEGVAATGVLRSVDGISAHFYRSTAPETVATDVDDIRAIARAAGVELPVWSGEWGYSAYDPNAASTGYNFIDAVSLERQASYVARMYLANYLSGVALSVYYQDHDPANPSPGNIEDHWGLYDDNLHNKPAYNALAALTRLVGAAPSRGTLRLGTAEHAVVFETSPQPTTVLWSESAGRWLVVPRASAVRLRARDGSDQTPQSLAEGQPTEIEIQPDEGPIYLVGDLALRRAETPAP